MHTNVGNLDRVIRFGVGAVVLVAGIALGQWWAILGAVPLASGVSGYCPIYHAMGMGAPEPKARLAPIDDGSRRRR
jgi:hypothetical protein